MNTDEQITLLKMDILELYERRKSEGDYSKIDSLKNEIDQKLKLWNQLQETVSPVQTN